MQKYAAIIARLIIPHQSVVVSYLPQAINFVCMTKNFEWSVAALIVLENAWVTGSYDIPPNFAIRCKQWS